MFTFAPDHKDILLHFLLEAYCFVVYIQSYSLPGTDFGVGGENLCLFPHSYPTNPATLIGKTILSLTTLCTEFVINQVPIISLLSMSLIFFSDGL